MENEASSSSWSPELETKWVEIQNSLKKKLIAEDDIKWKIPTNKEEEEEEEEDDDDDDGEQALKYVGGVDLSFSKHDSSIACGTLVVLHLKTLQVLYEDSSVVKLHVPYVPGFLAFREAPILLELLEKMKKRAHPYYPQLLMVDGNGLLHPRGFGLACHLGVLADLPTIGIGKNLHHVDGLTISRVKELLDAEGSSFKDILYLTGDSGSTWGAAMRSAEGSRRPIFISVGHRVSLATAINIVKLTCKFRIPEPIRQADLRSKDCLRKHQ